MKNQTGLSLKVLLAAFVAVAISACAKSDDKKGPSSDPAPVTPTAPEKGGGSTVPSVDENGACTPQFLEGWKAIESALNNTNRAGGLENADKACDTFFANHSGVVCKVKSATTDEENFLESKKYQENCTEIKRALGKPVEPANPGTNPAPEDDEVLVSSAPAGKTTLKVVDAEKMKTSMSNTKIYFVNGRIGPIEAFNNEIAAGASYCMMIDTKRAFVDKVGAGAAFTVLEAKDEVHRNGNRMLLVKLGDFFGLGCSKLSTQPYKFGEVRAALRGVADLTLRK